MALAIFLPLLSCVSDKEASAAADSTAQVNQATVPQQDPTKHPYASYEKLAGLVDGSDPTPFLLLDVRTSEEYAAGRIPGATLLPYDSIGPATAPAVAPDSLIVVYCRSGRRSAIAAQALKGLGFTNLADFGGITNWKGSLER